MVIIGVDYHPSDQYIAFADTETGESGERRLNRSDGEAEKFYRDLRLRGVSVRVGMEATGYSCWFERLLAELGIGGSAMRRRSRRSESAIVIVLVHQADTSDHVGGRTLASLVADLTGSLSDSFAFRIHSEHAVIL